MYRFEIRRTRVSGRMDNHERKVGNRWVVSAGNEFVVRVGADKEGATIKFEDGQTLRVASTGRQVTSWPFWMSMAARWYEGRQDLGRVPHS